MTPPIDVVTQANAKAGSVELDASVFGVKPRPHLFHAEVRRQLAARRAGTHSTKNRSAVSGGGIKPWKQKGTGRARQGSIRSPQWRGGGKAFGPKPRSHAIALPKKVRALALRHALSAKAKAGEIVVLEKAASADGKTKGLKAQLAALGLTNALFIDGAELDTGFVQAVRNIPNIDLLPVPRAGRRKLVMVRAPKDRKPTHIEMSGSSRFMPSPN